MLRFVSGKLMKTSLPVGWAFRTRPRGRFATSMEDICGTPPVAGLRDDVLRRAAQQHGNDLVRGGARFERLAESMRGRTGGRNHATGRVAHERGAGRNRGADPRLRDA